MCTRSELYRWSTTIYHKGDQEEEGLYVEEYDSCDEISVERPPIECGGGNKNNQLVVVGVYSNDGHSVVFWAETYGKLLVTLEDEITDDSTLNVI